MKRLQYIRFRIPAGHESAARQVLGDSGLPVPTVFENQDVELLATSHAVLAAEDVAERLIEGLKRSEIDEQPFSRCERKYTLAELESAQLFWVHVQKQKGDGYTVYGGRYDSEGTCGQCGSGAVQTGDLVVDCSDFKGVHFAVTHNFEVVISLELYEALKSLTGCRFGTVIDYRRNAPSQQFRQLIPATELPELVPPTRMVRSSLYCQRCGRNGVFIDSEMHLATAPAEVTDFYRTREFFGEVRERTCPGPELVLSWRTVDIIKEFDKRALKVEPVYVRDNILPRS